MAKKKTKKTVRKKARRPAKPKPRKSKKKKTTKAQTTRKRAKPKKGGGQTKYRATHPARAIGYAEDGSFKPHLLARKFNVSTATIRNWIASHPEFAAAVKLGKEIAVDMVHLRYFQMALGELKTKKGCLPANERAANRILAAYRKEFSDKIKADVGVSDELKSLLDFVDGGTKGKLPDKKERRNAK